MSGRYTPLSGTRQSALSVAMLSEVNDSVAAVGQDGPVEVTLQYFDGCPNWRETETRVREALRLVGAPATVLSLQTVSTPEDADRLGFRGSPTVLVGGVDPFASPSAPVGLACRMFRTPAGLAGAPTVDQLVAAMR